VPFWSPFAVAALVAVTAWGVGGYEPWAALFLEMGALLLGGWLFLSVLFRTSREERLRFLAIRRSQKKGTADIEIVEPASGMATRVPYRDPFYWLGFPFRRNGIGVLLALATLWVALSLLPLPPSALALLSPKALAVRTEAESLLGREPSSAPWSLTPYLTFQDLLLWIAFVLVFVVVHHTVASRRGVRRLSVSLVLVGVASGAYGLVQWLTALGGSEATTAFQASGSFGNRNHYAFFQEMLLLVGLGWLQMRWHEPRKAADRVEAQEEKAKATMVGLGVALIGLSLLFSLSRSGIAFAAAGGAFFLYLTRRARGAFLAVAGGLLAAALWIGVGPVVSRFEVIPDELSGETGRTTVWRDSLGAVGDFWLTGSGASSFQYVYPMYRSFGGRRFYSWAHNDYLQVAIELGLPGLALAAALSFSIARRARSVRRELVAAGSSLSELHAGYCAAALAVALHSFTDFGLHLPANAALFAVVLAAATGMTPSAGARKPPREKRALLRRTPPAA
jgi:putative inorganic carbon (hco3(-)) transporter